MYYKHKLPTFKVIDFQPTVTKSHTHTQKHTMCSCEKIHPNLKSFHLKETFNSLLWSTHIFNLDKNNFSLYLGWAV